MENVESKDEFNPTWKDLWSALKVGFFFAIGFNVGDVLWMIVSKIAALL